MNYMLKTISALILFFLQQRVCKMTRLVYNWYHVSQ